MSAKNEYLIIVKLVIKFIPINFKIKLADNSLFCSVCREININLFILKKRMLESNLFFLFGYLRIIDKNIRARCTRCFDNVYINTESVSKKLPYIIRRNTYGRVL